MTFAGFSIGAPWTVAIIAAILVTLFALLRLRLGRSPLPRHRAVVSWCGVILGSLAIGLAFGDVRESQVFKGRAILLLIDASASASPATRDNATRFWRELKASLGEDDLLAAAAFGQSVEVLTPFGPPKEQGEVLSFQFRQRHFDIETRLAAAIRTSQLLFPPGYARQTIVFSDGGGASFTTALPSNTALVKSRQSVLTDVALTSMHLTGDASDARGGATVEFVAYASAPTKASAGVSFGTFDASLSETLQPGLTPLALPLSLLPDSGTVVSIDVSAENDELSGNESLSLALPRFGRPPSIVIVDGGVGQLASQQLVQALRVGGIETTVLTPESMPSTASELDRYDALIIVDTIAARIGTETQEIIEAWTLAGGGLAMLGSANAFAPGGWYETPIERVLPVISRVERNPDSTVAMCIAMDISGSMGAMSRGNRTKLDEANRGADLAMRLAMNGDWFGILATDTANRWVSPMAPLNDQALVRSRIASNRVGGGGIDLNTSLSAALPALRASDAKRRFLILFADASDVDDKANTIDLISTARRSHNIETSVIALGEAGDKDVEFLRQFALAGGGQLHLTNNADRLPMLFSTEVARFTGGHIDERPMMVTVSAQGELTAGLNHPQAPQLHGMVLTQLRPQAVKWLGVSGGDHPLLASWRVGLGRALVFTSDARDQWADQWLSWDGYSKSWQRWARWLASGGGYTGAADADILFENDSVKIDLTHRAIGAGQVICQIWSPNRTVTRQSMDRLSSQRAIAAISARAAGTYRMDFWFEPADGGDVVSLGTMAGSRVPIGESELTHTDVQRLESLAISSGGGLAQSASQALAFGRSTSDNYEPTSIPTSMAAILSLTLLIGARRFPRIGRDTEPKSATNVDAVLAAWSSNRKALKAATTAKSLDQEIDDYLDQDDDGSAREPSSPTGRNTQDGASTQHLGRLLDARRERQKGE